MPKERKTPTPEELEARGRYVRVMEGLPDSQKVGPPMAAIFLNVSEKTLSRWRQGKKNKDGTVTGMYGPPFAQLGVDERVEAQNQGIGYEMGDLRKYFASLKVKTTMEGAVLRGLTTFSTLSDCLKENPFWIQTVTHEVKGSGMRRGTVSESYEVIVGSMFSVSEDQLKSLITDPTASIHNLSLNEAMKQSWANPEARKPYQEAYVRILRQSLEIAELKGT